MRKLKLLGLGLFFAVSSLLMSFSPVKAQDSYDDYDDSIAYRSYDGRGYDSSYYRYRYPRRIMRGATYPRTVYLIDSSNSANQLNIINATRGGSTTAAWIIVRPEVYDRVVDDYNELGVVSVRVNRGSNVVTFRTVDGTFSIRALSISFMR